MQIDWMDYDRKDHVLAWFLAEVMGGDMDRFGDFDSSAIEVEVKINGVDVSINETFGFLNAQLDSIAKKAVEDANAAVSEQRCRIIESAHLLIEELKQLDS